MSGFLGGGPANHGAIQGLAAKDIRLIANRDRGDFYRWYFWQDAFREESWYVNGYWPGGGASMDASGGEWCRSVSWEQIDINTGAIAKRGFSGYTRDVNGVIIAGATVRCFRTRDGLMTCQVVSDSTGFFTLDTPYYPDTHFYTAHKPTEVPEIAGVSPSTLVAG